MIRKLARKAEHWAIALALWIPLAVGLVVVWGVLRGW